MVTTVLKGVNVDVDDTVACLWCGEQMKLQQEANRKILELANKAQTEAIRLNIICLVLVTCITHEIKFEKDFNCAAVTVSQVVVVIFLIVIWCTATVDCDCQDLVTCCYTELNILYGPHLVNCYQTDLWVTLSRLQCSQIHKLSFFTISYTDKSVNDLFFNFYLWISRLTVNVKIMLCSLRMLFTVV